MLKHISKRVEVQGTTFITHVSYQLMQSPEGRVIHRLQVLYEL